VDLRAEALGARALGALGAFDTMCVSAELARGARAFLLDAHLRRGELRVCRDWCAVRPQRAEEVLRVFAAFLRARPREVLVLWWFPGGAEGAGGAERAAERAAVLHALALAYRRAGLAELSFRTTERVWPTFGELVARNARVVTLVDAGAEGPGAEGPGAGAGGPGPGPAGGVGGDAASTSFLFASGAEWDRRRAREAREPRERV
jgi:hypothetical protein